MSAPRSVIRPATLRAVERVKAGETAKQAARAEGIHENTLYVALKRLNVTPLKPCLPPETRARIAEGMRAYYAQLNAEQRVDRGRRNQARKAVKEAGRPLLRVNVDQACDLLESGLRPADVVAHLREAA